MAHAPLLLLTLALVFGVPTQGAGQAATPTIVGDVSGNWTGEIKTTVSYSPIPLEFKLQQSTKELTGTAWPSSKGGATPITNVKREGNKLHVEVSNQGQKYTFDLVLNGDRLEGDVKSEDQLGHTWTGKATLKRDKDKQQ
jgi:hypothetical protein